MTESTVPSSAPEMGAFARLTGVLFSPAKTFESVASKPGWDWLVPVALLFLLTCFAAFYINPKLDVEGAIKQTMKRIDARTDIPDAQKDQIRERVRGQFESAKSGNLRFLGPIFVLIPILVVPGIYFGAAKAFGAGKSFLPILAGYAYAQVPQVLKGIVGIGVALPRDSIDINEAERLVKSNIGAFMDAETTSRPLLTILTSVDLFEIWGLVLCSIMLARSTRMSKNAATATVVSLWVIWVLVKVGGAAIGAAFGG